MLAAGAVAADEVEPTFASCSLFAPLSASASASASVVGEKSKACENQRAHKRLTQAHTHTQFTREALLCCCCFRRRCCRPKEKVRRLLLLLLLLDLCQLIAFRAALRASFRSLSLLAQEAPIKTH